MHLDQSRSLQKEALFWKAFGSWFSCTPVLSRARGSSVSNTTHSPWERFGAESGRFIFVARRKETPFADLGLTLSDSELMEGPMGVGNDFFECMLLMDLGGLSSAD